jgi:hypothetical protein
MARGGKRDLRWSERERELGTWLAGRASAQRTADAIPRARRLRAYATLWGWMPLAAIIFWIAFILTRSVSFVDESGSPTYRITAFGTDKSLATAEFIEDPPSGAHIDFYLPRGVQIVRLDNVAADSACDVPGGRYERVKGVWRAEFGLANAKYTNFDLYGRSTAAAYVRCTLNWHPGHSSYATYSARIENWDVGAVQKSKLPPGAVRLQINVGAPLMEGVRLATVAGMRLSYDERTLVPSDFVWAVWRGGEAEQSRDTILIVIGALIALGGALVVEALRGEVELAIESNSPNIGGDAA